MFDVETSCFYGCIDFTGGCCFDVIFYSQKARNFLNLYLMRYIYPVIVLSFADIKENTAFGTKKRICQIIEELYNQYDFLLDSGCMNEKEKENFGRVTVDMNDYEAVGAIKMLSLYLSRYYNKQVILLLDEYDTPFQEAYLYGYWDELVDFVRGLFNSTFKTNPYLERALMTGITRVSKESIFSDLNNLRIVSTTTNSYTDSFGFTWKESKFGYMDLPSGARRFSFSRASKRTRVLAFLRQSISKRISVPK